MLKRIVQACFLIVGGTLGIFLLPELFTVINLSDIPLINNPYMTAIFGAIIFYILTFWAVEYVVNFVKWFEDSLVKAPVTDLLFGSLGLIIGLFVAYLSGIPFNQMEIPIVNTVVPILLTLLLGYLGFQVGFKKRDELVGLFGTGNRGKKKGTDEDLDEEGVKTLKILDTSVIIDGRIADICQTGFLEGIVVIPQFVLEELQHIADSSDVLKRNRGRRGLDILNRIQKELPVEVQIYEGDFEEIQEVDSKLVKLAKLTNGIVVTNDFNLNKVCDLQGVQVLNINDLANAVKPVVLPGEELKVQVIKDGKEHNQGIAYLDDGTMIVVEEGRNYIGKYIDVLVTSVLQTSAGRMIFAKPKQLEKAL
ncbi:MULTISPECIES: PIN/TRAM domain-containing protein [Bacillaceae]|uniref:PIN/TRAM domain-containing protein n=1 Tax=Bacillaceae TaxID=186817 RepID=UPI001C58B980|nr:MULTISPECIES: PIN/TRAM domain-containing protein [Rossellomorea]MBW3111333.1 PIN/TRAM domain-containing protein [Bacillus sp. MCCB 382]MDX8345902.1 PIN/TRAM domain-containing protein [Rossellomorea sp. YZS02]